MSIVAKVWDMISSYREEKNNLMGWLDSPLVLEYYTQPKVTGEKKMNWLVGLAKNLNISEQSRWLSLGCGSAGQEIYASQEGLFTEMDAYDLSPASIKIAKKNSLNSSVSNINFNFCDFNSSEFKIANYDVILMNMSLHHVKELEQLFTKIKDGLADKGLFIINEYIGPSQMQFTEKQLKFICELLAILPDKYKFNYVTKETKNNVFMRTKEEWDQVDPSEAIRSDEIVPLLNQYFKIVKRIDYGGTIVHPLLEHIIANFKEESEDAVTIIRLLMYIEEVLIREGVLDSDFAVMAMGNKTEKK